MLHEIHEGANLDVFSAAAASERQTGRLRERGWERKEGSEDGQSSLGSGPDQVEMPAGWSAGKLCLCFRNRANNIL